MNKRNQVITAAIVTLLPTITHATAGWNITAAEAPTNAPTNLENMILKATNWILGFVALIAVLMIIWGGFQYLTSAGSQDQARTGKDTIKYALMGLIIAGVAFALVNIIVNTILR